MVIPEREGEGVRLGSAHGSVHEQNKSFLCLETPYTVTRPVSLEDKNDNDPVR